MKTRAIDIIPNDRVKQTVPGVCVDKVVDVSEMRLQTDDNKSIPTENKEVESIADIGIPEQWRSIASRLDATDSDYSDVIRELLQMRAVIKSDSDAAIHSLCVLYCCARLFERDELKARYRQHVDNWREKDIPIVRKAGVNDATMRALDEKLKAFLRVI